MIKPRSLKFRFLLGLLIPLLCGAIVTSAIFGYLTQQQLHEEIRKQTELIADNVETSLRRALWNFDIATVRNIAASVAVNDGVRHVVVRNDNGEILAEKGEPVAGGAETIKRLERPIHYQADQTGRVMGRFRIDFDLTHRREEVIQQILRDTALIAVVLGLMAAAAMMLMHRMVLRPLGGFDRAFKRTQTAGVLEKVEKHADDEIGRIVDSYNGMIERISEHEVALEEKSRTLQQINSALTDSISYASLLQSALLPERGEFAEIAEHFEIWWPRDVVGGDVYVVRPTADGMLLGVMDCTGHGVPGAFMTVAASAAFDHAVAVCGGHSPGAILAEVNRYMRKRLDRSFETGVDDGLEMGLVCWRPRARELVFAGGGLDLAVVDPAEARPPEAGETDPPGVSRIRGDRAGLGHRRSRPDHVFTDRPMQVTPGRAFYIASDGMLDQVGGPMKVSLGWRRFRSVLAAAAAHPMAEQREHIVAALQDWQGDCAQRDDITLIGFRPVAAPADTRDGGWARSTGLGGVAQPDAADATDAADAKP